MSAAVSFEQRLRQLPAHLPCFDLSELCNSRHAAVGRQKNHPAHQGFFFRNEIKCFLTMLDGMPRRGIAVARNAVTRPRGFESMEQSAGGLVRTTARANQQKN